MLKIDSLGFTNRNRVWRCIESCIDWIGRIRAEIDAGRPWKALMNEKENDPGMKRKLKGAVAQ